MNVCIVINSVVPVTKYGGTQRVMWSLAKSLARHGHEVTLLCRRGSGPCPFGRIVEIDDQRPVETQIPSGTDIVHLNDMSPSALLGLPHIVTYHGNRINGEISRNAVFVSADHARRFGAESYVHNGLDWDDYPAAALDGNRDVYHFLGKGAWSVKNLKGCISLVKAMPGARLEALGASRFNFKMGIRLTFSRKVRFHDMVDNAAKARIISRSKGLLFPVLWDEPFGLAVIESLYYGAPVYATPHGSLPELVDGSVGILAADREEMLRALCDHHDFSPEVCHEYAAARFNSDVMAANYIDKYRIAMGGGWLNSATPHPVRPYDRYAF